MLTVHVCVSSNIVVSHDFWRQECHTIFGANLVNKESDYS